MEECREWQEQQQQKVIHKWHTGWACLIFQDCLLHQNCSSTENCLAVSQISDSQMSSGASDGRKFACNVGDLGLTPGLWTSPGEVHGKSHQYSSSVQFGHSVLFDSLQPHGMQHAKPLCSTPTPRFYSNSCSLSQWCHPTISSSVIPFSSCLQSFPASGSFQMSQFYPSGGQSIGVSASTSVLPMNIHDWFPLGWTDWISSQSKRSSRVFSNTTVQKHQFFGVQISI